MFGQAGRQAWLTQSRPHMGLLSQPLSLHVMSHLSLLSSLYIWPHLLTISASLPRFLFITVLLTPLYFLIFFLSPSLPCGVSIWRSDSEGHSEGRGGLGRGMKSLDGGRKTLSVYKWVKRDICIFFVCVQATWGHSRLEESLKKDALCPGLTLFILSMKTKASLL